MEEVKDLRFEPTKGPDALIEKLAAFIPGYEGYQDREKRRDADKKHREYIAVRLSKKKAALTEIGEELLDNDMMQYVSKLNDLTMDIDSLSNRIRAAATGGSSVLLDIQADTELLDRIYENDLALLQSVESLDEKIGTLSDAVDTEDNVKMALKGVQKALKGLQGGIDLRDKIVRGLE
jgi:hypothetical protein